MHDSNDPQTAIEAANGTAYRRFAFILGGGLVFAFCFPQVLFSLTFGMFLSLGSGVVGVLAFLAREPVWSRHLTRWDVAAGLYALSLLAGFFVDYDAVHLFVLEQQTLVMG